MDLWSWVSRRYRLLGIIVVICLFLCGGIYFVNMLLSHSNTKAPDVLWDKTYTILGAGCSLINTSDGGYVIAGYATLNSNENLASNNGYCAYLFKTDAKGNTIWKNFAPDGRLAYAVLQSSDGGYAVTGYSTVFGNGTAHTFLTETDENGKNIWGYIYPATGYDTGYAVVQTRDGGYVIAGTASDGGLSTDSSITTFTGNCSAFLLKTDSNGSQVWRKTYGDGNVTGYSLALANDGGFVIAGITTLGNSSMINLIKTDADGNQLWSRNYDPTNGSSGDNVTWGAAMLTGDGGYAIAESRGYNVTWSSIVRTIDGGYAIAGTISQIFDYDGPFTDNSAFLMKTDANGNMLWQKGYRGPPTFGHSVIQTSDGGYAIAGSTGSGGDLADLKFNFALIKTDSTGHIQWSKTLGNFTQGVDSIVQTGDGDYALAGGTQKDWGIYLAKIGA
jgi:hypothetical protein